MTKFRNFFLAAAVCGPFAYGLTSGFAAAQAEPITAATVAKALILDEARKCANGVGVSGGCLGPSGEGAEIVKKNIIGPISDVAGGDIGRSDKSVWRQIGLPRVKLW